MTQSNWRWIGPSERPTNHNACGWCGRRIGYHSPTSLEVCLTSLSSLSSEELKRYNDLLERCQKAENEAAYLQGKLSARPVHGTEDYYSPITGGKTQSVDERHPLLCGEPYEHERPKLEPWWKRLYK